MTENKRYEVICNNRTMVYTDNYELADSTAKWYLKNMALLNINELFFIDYELEWCFEKRIDA